MLCCGLMPRLMRGYNRFDAWLEALCFEKHLVPISIIIIVIVVFIIKAL